METNQKQAISPVPARVMIAQIKDIEWQLVDRNQLGLSQDREELSKSIAVNVQGNFDIDTEKRFFILRLTINYSRPSTDSRENIVLKYTNEITFYIENFTEVMPVASENTQTGEKAFTVPADLLENFISTMLSTMRGILVEKTANSYMKNLYLPMLNYRQVMEQIFS